MERRVLPVPIGTMRKILIADDSAANRELLRAVLQHAGYVVIEAEHGAAALDLLRAERPDLAVLDLQMPELDGFGAIARIRADPELRALPVIAVTAYAMDADRERAVAAGFTAYISKPFRLSEVRERIAALLPP